MLPSFDLCTDFILNREEAEALAKRMKLRFYRTSVKENLNVEDVFRYLTERYIERLHSTEPEDNSTISAKIGIFNTSTTPSQSENNGNGNEANQTIQLKPMKQRTKGKKSAFKCSIL
nr:ras-related protein Rab-23-like [Lytechinus pictus]